MSKQAVILKAGLESFSRYGYRRTSMDDIAAEAGVSRPALYLHFRNKEDIFRTLSVELHAAALERAKQVLEGRGRLRTRLRRALDGFAAEQAALASHERLDPGRAIRAELSADAQARFERLLARALRRAHADGEIDLRRARLSAKKAARLLHRASQGTGDADGLLRLFHAAVALR